MNESSAKVRLVLESRPESVTLVRSMLSAFADAAGIDHAQLNSLRTTISEASNNVVVHAYHDETGPLSVAIAKSQAAIDVLVEDHGGGIHRVIPSPDRMGLGLAVISSLADRAEFSNGPDGGTQVHLQFGSSSAAVEEHRQVDHLPEPEGLSGDLVVSLTPSPVLSQVLGRLLRAMAAQSFFPVSALADLGHISDRLGAVVNEAGSSDTICFAISAAPHRLGLRIGPFEPGTGSLRAARLGALGDLVESVTIDQANGEEFIVLAVVDGSGR